MKTPMLRLFIVKVLRNKKTSAQEFRCEFCDGFKDTFFTEQLRETVSAQVDLSTKKLHIAGVRKKIFNGQLVAIEFLPNNKKYLRSASPFLVLLFCTVSQDFQHNLYFSIIEGFEQLCRNKDPFIQIIRNYRSKSASVDLLKKCLSMNANL